MDADVFTSILGEVLGATLAFGLCPLICLIIKKKTETMVAISWIIPAIMIYGNLYQAKISGDINGFWIIKHAVAIGIVICLATIVTVKYNKRKKINEVEKKKMM